MNKQDLEKLNDITQLITDTAERHIGLVIEQSDRDIGSLMNTFQSLLKTLQESDSASSKDITAILEALQFHDRTNQILNSVQNSIGLFRNAVSDLSSGKDVDLNTLESSLKESFVVAEQYANDEDAGEHVDKDQTHFF